jgi:hypothetical protein
MWLDAHEQLWTLSPETYVDAVILDRYLIMASQAISHTGVIHARYIPFNFLRSTEPTDAEIAYFRRLSGLPPTDTSCPLEPVLGIIHEHEHFYVVVILPGRDEIHVLGKEISNQVRRMREDWNQWSRLLSGIGRYYHGWDMQDYSVLRVDWPQNGYDCGPIACQVAIHILCNDFQRDFDGFWAMPDNLPCAHRTRRSMIHLVNDRTIRYTRPFHFPSGESRLLKQTYAAELDAINGQVQVVMNKLLEGRCIIRVLAQLEKAVLVCESCKGNDLFFGPPVPHDQDPSGTAHFICDIG